MKKVEKLAWSEIRKKSLKTGHFAHFLPTF
nr:MAG TPA: hypothetical protein [Caudoviricetes sp.]